MAGLNEGLRQLVLRAAVDSAWEIRGVEALDQLAAAIRRKLVKTYVQMADMLDKVLVVWHELNLWLESLQEAAPKPVADMRSQLDDWLYAGLLDDFEASWLAHCQGYLE